MKWLKNLPFLSLILLFITYGIFGWYLERGSPILRNFVLDYSKAWGWHRIFHILSLSDDAAAIGLVYFFSILAIFFITLASIAPIASVTILFGGTFQSSAKSIMLILLWSLGFVVMLRWLAIFSQLLLLICAAILAKLDLQDNGYPRWFVFIVVKGIGLSGFVLGAIAHSFYGSSRVHF